jgi:hypothetical protein
MDVFSRDGIDNMKNTRIITRSGSTSSIPMLRHVGLDTARSVIILDDIAADASDEDKSLADARVLKTLLALMSCIGEENAPSVVAELHNENIRKLAKNTSPDKISIIDEHSIVTKLIVQTSCVSGLAQVYDNIVGFKGCRFYFYKPDRGIEGIKYSELLFHFKDSSVCGIRKKAQYY